MAQRKFRAESKKIRNKSLAVKLIISFAAVLAVYFGCIKARVIIIQDIYIWAAFILGIAYIFLSAYIAYMKQSGDKNKTQINARIKKAENICRYLLIFIFSTVVSLLLDYMIILLGFADILGI